MENFGEADESLHSLHYLKSSFCLLPIFTAALESPCLTYITTVQTRTREL